MVKDTNVDLPFSNQCVAATLIAVWGPGLARAAWREHRRTATVLGHVRGRRADVDEPFGKRGASESYPPRGEHAGGPANVRHGGAYCPLARTLFASAACLVLKHSVTLSLCRDEDD